MSGFMSVPGSPVTFASRDQRPEAANSKAFSEQTPWVRAEPGWWPRRDAGSWQGLAAVDPSSAARSKKELSPFFTLWQLGARLQRLLVAGQSGSLSHHLQPSVPIAFPMGQPACVLMGWADMFLWAAQIFSNAGACWGSQWV